MIASTIRVVAQKIRHAPGLRSCTSLWNVVRTPYTRALRILARDQGISVRLAGSSIKIDPSFAAQNWESIETECYRTFAAELRRGDIVYDVGAHIGTYSVLAAQLIGSSGRLVAYEPMEGTRSFLKLHLRLNGAHESVIVRPFCCGSECREALFYHGPDAVGGDSSLVPMQGFEHTRVRVVTLDSEVAELGLVPSVLKIDVEGWEWEVLKGATNTLDRYGPCLLVSLHPKALAQLGASPNTVLAWLETRGYTCKIIESDHEIHVLAKVKGE
jgi:FkbM family methyltransferase